MSFLYIRVSNKASINLKNFKLFTLIRLLENFHRVLLAAVVGIDDFDAEVFITAGHQIRTDFHRPVQTQTLVFEIVAAVVEVVGVDEDFAFARPFEAVGNCCQPRRISAESSNTPPAKAMTSAAGSSSATGISGCKAGSFSFATTGAELVFQFYRNFSAGLSSAAKCFSPSFLLSAAEICAFTTGTSRDTSAFTARSVSFARTVFSTLTVLSASAFTALSAAGSATTDETGCRDTAGMLFFSTSAFIAGFSFTAGLAAGFFLSAVGFSFAETAVFPDTFP